MSARKILFLGLLAASLTASGFLQRGLNRDREAMGITRTTVISNAPPVLAFTTVALGAFRGLIANALWVRATDMQEEGKYFEAVQLADWITKLQPHSDAPWIFQAWNMAYNISVKFPDPFDRWLWVQRGIELLRDQGLRYNPNKALMYRELGWLFQHKMGANLDDAHHVYKGQWAMAVNEILPGGHPDYAALLDPKTPEDQARVKALVEKFKFDPRLMQRLDQTYGPFDWRLPEASAIYWATLGIEHSQGQDIMPLLREIYQPMQASLHHGRIITNRLTGLYDLRPNLDMIPNASKAYEDAQAAATEQNHEHIGRAHRNFLKDAVYFLYANNRETEARKWFNYMKQRFGVGPQSGIDPDATMESFALGKIEEDANETSRDRVTQALQGLLTRAYYNLASGDDDQGVGLEKIAQRLHDVYTAKTTHPSSKDRVALPPLSEMKRDVLLEMLRPDPEVNPEFQQQLRTRLGLPADFGVPATNAAPSATPGARTGN
ncbi:MAG: hypothetical protein KIT22_11520 [Verrucomicrobiae bacterium]|nr:hypothetical protein [Verrucomicrobiae bacterium]